MFNTFRDDFICLFFIPTCKNQLAFYLESIAESESIVELEGGPLRIDQFQVKGWTEEWECLAVNILFGGSRHGQIGFFTGAYDPIRFFVNELLDQCQRCPHRRADGEGAIAFDDQGDGSAFTADKCVDLDLHDNKKPARAGFSVPRGRFGLPTKGLWVLMTKSCEIYPVIIGIKDKLPSNVPEVETFFAMSGDYKCSAWNLFGKPMKMKGTPKWHIIRNGEGNTNEEWIRKYFLRG